MTTEVVPDRLESGVLKMAAADRTFTWRELCDVSGVEPENARSKHKWTLIARGLLHVVGWRPVAKGRRPEEYRAGPGEAPVRPKFCKRRAAREWKRRNNYTMRQRVERVAAEASSPLAALLAINHGVRPC